MPDPGDDDFTDERPRRRRPRDEDDDTDEDYVRRRETDATGGVIPYKNPKALAAYYCGVFGLITCVLVPLALFGIVPIILGLQGLKYAKKHPEARGRAHAVTGIVLGSLEVLAFLGVIVAIAVAAMAG